MKECSLIIEKACLITMDKDRSIINPGSVAIQGDRIIAVGPTDNIKSQYQTDTYLDGSNMVVLPGLINTHLHSLSSIVRGSSDGYSIEDWLAKELKPMHKCIRPQDAYVFGLLCYAESIKSGTTTCLDMDGFPFELAEAAKDVGIRAVISPSASDRPELAFESFETNVQFVKERHEYANGRVQAWFGIEYLPNATPNFYKRVRQAATDFGVGINTHAGDSYEVQYAIQNYGMPTVELYNDWNFLGPDLVLGHCVNLTHGEIKLLADTGTHVSHCPQAELKLGMRVAPILELMDAGVNVALGTDGSAEDSSVDSFENMKFASLVHKGYNQNPMVMDPMRVMEMATLNGALALGLDKEIGSIEVGKKADLIIVNLQQLRYAPIFSGKASNHLSRLVYAIHSDDVDTVVIDGKIVMQGRILCEIDEKQLLKDAQETADYLMTVVNKPGDIV